jgi:hypothetical protein
MEDTNQTSVMKICGACGLDLLGRDKYCRHCGIKQPTTNSITTGVVTISGLATSNLLYQPPAAPTSALFEADTYHKVSEPLVEAVAMRITARAFGKSHGQFVRSALSALISITIWLMIVLLAPLDAYFAAKDISSQVALK